MFFFIKSQQNSCKLSGMREVGFIDFKKKKEKKQKKQGCSALSLHHFYWCRTRAARLPPSDITAIRGTGPENSGRRMSSEPGRTSAHLRHHNTVTEAPPPPLLRDSINAPNTNRWLFLNIKWGKRVLIMKTALRFQIIQTLNQQLNEGLSVFGVRRPQFSPH